MINKELAADGIDELLRGFLPRRKSKTSEAPHVIEGHAVDADQRWQVAISDQPHSAYGVSAGQRMQ